MPTATPENSTRLIRRRQVEERTGLGRSSLYAKIARGEFPAPVKLGARASAWINGEVEAWICARVSASRSGSEVQR